MAAGTAARADARLPGRRAENWKSDWKLIAAPTSALCTSRISVSLRGASVRKPSRAVLAATLSVPLSRNAICTGA